MSVPPNRQCSVITVKHGDTIASGSDNSNYSFHLNILSQICFVT